MAPRKIQTVCGCSCSDCDNHTKECAGCLKTEGKPFWTSYIGIDRCAIYDCCTNERKLPHCGKCPDLMCDRYNRIRDTPGITEEQVTAALTAMEMELRSRK